MVDGTTNRFMDLLAESEADVENIRVEEFYHHDQNYGGYRVHLDLLDDDDLDIVQELAGECGFSQDDEDGEVWIRGLE